MFRSHPVLLSVCAVPGSGTPLGAMRIDSQGQQAIITGDMFHHPLQLVHPEWDDNADVEGELAFRTRSEFLAKHADRPVLVLGTHFAAPTGGHLVRDGDVYRFAV